MENLADLLDLLDLDKNEVVSIIGSGGKTTLLCLLSNAFRHEKILISTTTHLQNKSFFDYDYYFSGKDIGEDFEIIKNGIYLGAEIETTKDGTEKLKSLDYDLLSKICGNFDKVFLESDGSKMLPLKAWKDFEPVVIAETTTTIGILPINVLGKPANENLIHRFDDFKKITNIKKNEILEIKHLVTIISHEIGLMKFSKGKKIIILNKAESEIELSNARKLAKSLPRDFLNKINLIIGGSIKNNQGDVLYDGKLY